MEKRLLAFALSLLLAEGICAQTPVHFADDNLKAAVEAQLWISDPTADDMLGLTSLYAGDDDIIDLTGLEYAVNLQTLELPNNSICDVSALSGLVDLRVLSLRSNQVSDILPLSGLNSLENLDLFDNQVGDISALSGLANLEVLNFQRNAVSDVSPLSGLSRLRTLDLHRNQVSDVSALIGLPLLEWLDLRINPLSEESYSSYIPQIRQNHPDMWLAYYPSTRRQLTLSSTAGGSVISPGEGEFTWEHGTVIWLQAEAEPGFTFSHWSGSYSSPRNPIFLTMDDNFQMRANFVCARDIIYVNNGDAADVVRSGFRQDGTPEHPFDRIQEAVEVAAEGASIIVYPGLYRETLDFLGKGIHLIGIEVNEPNGATWPVIDGGGADTVVTFADGEDSDSMLIGFAITGGRGQSAGAIQCIAAGPTIANCLIAGNRAIDPNGAAVLCADSQATFINCVITDNHAGENGAGLYLRDGRVVVVNSIIRANAPAGIVEEGGDHYVRFSDITGGWPGRGNVDLDPLFAKPGRWVDRNHPDVVVSPANPDAAWVMGDYHLKSRTGRWDPVMGLWVHDRTSSPCIDAGDPRSSVDLEPFPNGGIINMGIYGGTPQACKSDIPALAPNWGGGR